MPTNKEQLEAIARAIDGSGITKNVATLLSDAADFLEGTSKKTPRMAQTAVSGGAWVPHCARPCAARQTHPTDPLLMLRLSLQASRRPFTRASLPTTSR